LTTLYIIRHGETDTNRTQRIAGRYQAALTGLGLQQAGLTAAYLQNIPFDAVYASDLTRAIRTAEKIAQPRGLQVIPDKQLSEIDLGDWENLSLPQVQAGWPALYEQWMYNQGYCHCPNGESVPQVQSRIFNAVTRLAKLHDGQTLCIVSHGLVIKTLYAKACGYTLDSLRTLQYVSNASVSLFTFENGTLAARDYGLDEHLHAYKTDLFPEA